MAHEHTLELLAVLLMSLTAVVTAWSGYQAATWSGTSSASYSRASSLRTEATRVSSTADRQRQVDVTVVIAWVEAIADGDQPLADFLRERFPDRLGPAADAWLAADPIGNPDAPATPLDMPEYVVPADAEVARLQAEADRATADAHSAADHVDHYVVMGVVFAVVLFLAGVSGKLDSRKNRAVLLGVALAGLVVAGTVLALLPVEV